VKLRLGANPATCSGLVTDPAGKPVAGAQVRVEMLQLLSQFGFSALIGLPESPAATDLLTTTDQAGCFSLPDLPRFAVVSLLTIAPGYAETSAGVQLLGGLATAQITLEPEATIAGRVTRDGQPVAGVSVWIWAGANRVSPVVTGADGGYLLRGLPAGRFRVNVTNCPEGLIASPSLVTLAAGQALTGCDLKLTPGAVVSGAVREAGTNRPLAGCHVGDGGAASHGPHLEWLGATTDASGVYHLRVPAGKQTLLAEGPVSGEKIYTSAQTPALDLQEGETREGVDLVLAPIPGVSGQVLLPDGSPAAGVQVGGGAALTLAGGDPDAEFDTVTDAQGHFSLPPNAQAGPNAAPWVFTVDTARGLAGMVLAAPDQPVTVTLAPAAYMTTRVLDLQDQPVAGISVWFVAMNQLGLQNTGGMATSDQQGQVKIGPLPAGVSFRVAPAPDAERVLAPDPNAPRFKSAKPGPKPAAPYAPPPPPPGPGGVQSAPSWYNLPTVVLTPGETRELPVLRVNPAGQTLRGTVTDATGKPVPGALVGSPQDPQLATADASGKFVLAGLDARGPVWIVAADPAQPLVAAAKVDPEDTPEMTLTLGPLATLTGQEPPGDAAAQQVAVRLQTPDLQLASLPGPLYARLQAAGVPAGTAAGPDRRWQLHGLLPGVTYTVSAWGNAPNRPGWALEVTLEPGQTLDASDFLAHLWHGAGDVVDQAGHPIAGARLSAQSVGDRRVAPDGPPLSGPIRYSPSPGQVISDDAGHFDLGLLRPDTVLLVLVNADGFGELNQEFPPGSQTGPLHLVLQPEATIAGKVTRDGQPAAGVQIRCDVDPSVRDQRPWMRSAPAQTAADGTYTISGLAAGTYVLSAGPGTAGYVAASLTGVTVQAGDHLTGKDFALVRGGTISGHVTGNGKPLAGVGLQAWSRDPGGQSNAVTDAQGAYQLTGLNTGMVTVGLTNCPPDFARPMPVQVAARLGEDVAGPDFALVTGASISGQVSRDGKPMPGVQIVAWAGAGNGPGSSAQTDAAGNYTLTSLIASTYTLSVQSGGAGYIADQITGVTVGTGDHLTGKDFALVRGGSISGHVTGDGKPLAGVSLRAWGQTGDGGQANAVTDADGAYQLLGLDTGTFTVVLSDCGDFAPPDRTQVEVRRGEDTAGQDFALALGATLSGQVTRDGKPVVGVQISAWETGRGGRGSTAQTGADGRYTLHGLAEATYTLQVQPDAGGYVADPLAGVTVPAGGHVTGKDFALVRGGTISGHVTGGGKPLAGVQVQAWGAGQAQAVTGADGAYQLAGLSGGNYTMRLNDTITDFALPGDKEVTVRLGEDVTGQDFALEPGATISGVVTGDGKPVSGAEVEGSPLGNGRSQGAHATTGADGSYTLHGLGAGAYQVTVTPGGGDLAPGQLQVTVHAAEHVIGQDVVLTPGVLITGTVLTMQTQDPVPGVFVSVNLGDRWSGNFLGRTGTSADGTYRVRCAPGHLTVSVRGNQQQRVFVPGSRTLDGTEGQTCDGQDFTLCPPPELQGQVLRPDGTPAVGVKVYGHAPGYAANNIGAAAPPSVTTDADGNFKLPPDLEFRPEGGGSFASSCLALAVDPDLGEVALVVTDSPYRPVTLQLAPGGYLELPIVDQDGNPLADIGVVALVSQPWAWLPEKWTSGADGHLEIGPLPGGLEYRLYLPQPIAAWTLDAAWNFGTEGGFALAADQHKQLPPLRLLNGGRTVRGSVSDAQGNPAPGALVYGTSGSDDPAIAAADGTFELKKLKAVGPIDIVATAPTQSLAAGVEMDPQGGVGPHLTLGALGSVTGQIVDAAGQPVTGVQVSCFPDTMWGMWPVWNRLQQTGFQRWATTDDQGRWRIDGVIPGLPEQARGGFDPQGNGQSWQHDITVQAGQTLDLGVIKPPGGTAPAVGAGGPPPPG
jgi:hypothetical protein